jgi:hypothetical protein
MFSGFERLLSNLAVNVKPMVTPFLTFGLFWAGAHVFSNSCEV